MVQSAPAHLAMLVILSLRADQPVDPRFHHFCCYLSKLDLKTPIDFFLQANVVGFSRFRRSLNPYFLLFPEN